ncbi:MAG TPA: VCBS repeat-containing protein [Opitutus sp.]|nr:VCBS repeat-containing protein [Opitutus sp.]
MLPNAARIAVNSILPRNFALLAAIGFASTGLTLLNGCGRPETASLFLADKRVVVNDTSRFTKESIGKPFEGKPWVSHVNVVDLDRDGKADILACDDKLNGVVWLRQSAPGKFDEFTLISGITSPVHVEAVDMDGDQDLDLLVACMGEVFPNNDKIGSILILENDGAQNFTKHVIAENITRVTDVRAGDFDGDGRLDLAVAQFGYDQGEIRWMRNLGEWKFESRNLLNLSGAINVCVADLNGDRTLDIVAIVSQQWEEIHLFENNGAGQFTDRIIFGSTNEDFGSSGISLCDLNRDGRPDILYTNGDGFAYADPGRRPWHGVQWLENLGGGSFRFHRIGDLPGAYSPVGVDLDGTGVMDVVCTSGFNDWKNPEAKALVVFKNDGRMNFTLHVLAHAPIQLITCAVGDLDGSGKPSIVTAGFYSYPPYDRMDRITLWRPAANGIR